ncbi:DEAD/DEAH box helicase [Planctomicrobium piriforme]|uniref:ATP-dependent helicase Lhr and Lhr-like helicase n=1 Tax=Planctomicrobium piriforme TaxID=1576369 RepID=A0A1I3C5U3_9PLAN|nr:DEAD/DEAH box helicase [Planctomicrobium piriforme]SFH69696.1 ATP-dependent helicase Lhr and Lhr-like helicase [Planctomicrobium piriforme]
MLDLFHPVIQDWFRSRFQGPTEPQSAGWPHIARGDHTLIAAPTGSGKTLTAFLAVIDRLFRESVEGRLRDELQVVYISPLRALSNDMQRNLSGPLLEIQAVAVEQGINCSRLRTGLRTGDTTASQRAALVKRPPHLLVTTPESLYLLLTSEKGRAMLRSVNTVIVDEIHALVRDKRGSHLAVSLERLAALTASPLQRIGLSATQKPIERMADFLIGSPNDEAASSQRSTLNPQRPACQIVDVGHRRPLDLAIEVPPSDLQAACSHDQWAEINARIVELINGHRSTLIFVNTRRLAERLTHQLTQLLGENAVGSHHGSLSKEMRLDTEQKLKDGELKAVVATSSLELGIDVGYIDLVLQIGSPRAIAAFLQRIGRSGHALGLTPKGRLFALTRDELVECMALIRAVRQGRLDVTPIPIAPLDILSQQIVAETALEDWDAEELYATFRRAWPYRELTRERFEHTLTILSSGLTEHGGRGQSMIYYDRINGRVKGRRAARLLALSNGGAIAEVDSVRVVLEDESTVVGTVDEEFAVESSAGDIFLLGNSSWRIHRLRGNDLLVGDAQGAPPTIPFWRGEAPGRTIELSEEVSLLRQEMERRLIEVEQKFSGDEAAESDQSVDEQRPSRWKSLAEWLLVETSCSDAAAWQIVIYMAAQRAAIGLLPTQQRIVFERFFDESGGMQMVVHAPFGGRINRGWGLAFRKRFCRSFDFELQASADDDGFLLSLGPQHSFPIETLFPMMRTDNARNLLEQALLVAPMFHFRWRANVTRSLFVSRMRNGKKVPPALQRFRSEDLLTAVFPKLTGCQENIVGDHEIPDHPLVQQTMEDCLFEALDIEGLIEVLGRIEAGEITLVGRDTREPSPFAYELLNANPYAFLDGGEVQERRARAVATRRSLSVESLQDLGRLDPVAIERVVAEAQPEVRDADELHDLLVSRLLVPVSEGPVEGNAARHGLQLQSDHYCEFFESLVAEGRAAEIEYSPGKLGWAAVECWPAVATLFPEAANACRITVPVTLQREWQATDALMALLRGWVETSGPVTAVELADLLGMPVSRVFASLEAIEGEGLVLRGRFASTAHVDSNAPEIEWCHRRLLARIHRRTMTGLRQEIEAVEPAVYIEFLARHQGVLPGYRKSGADGVHEVISQLQGMDLAAGAWEQGVLPARVESYRAGWLDELCLSGDVGWGRLEPRRGRIAAKGVQGTDEPAEKCTGRPMASMTRSIPVSLFLRDDSVWLTHRSDPKLISELSESACEVGEKLKAQGALFSADLCQQLKLLPSQLDDLLGELVAAGCLTSDGFSGLRQLIGSETSTATPGLPSRYRRVRQQKAALGRWTLLNVPGNTESDIVEEWAWQLIRRWGVVFRDLLQREPLAPAWWELLRVYRKLEARGELRGGRFIRGVGGEQFATSDAVRELRAVRQCEGDGDICVISGADPLNLTGVVGPGKRLPALAAHQLAYRRGVVVAWKKGDESWISPALRPEDQQRLAMQWGIVGNTIRVERPPVSLPEVPQLVSEQQPPAAAVRRKRKPPVRSGLPKPFPF